MRATIHVIARLEKLKKFVCLGSRVTDSFGFPVENYLYSVVDWLIEEHKPIIGPSYQKLVRIDIKSKDHIGTIYVGRYTIDLENILNKMEKDRKNFINIKKDLELMDFKIIKNEKD